MYVSLQLILAVNLDVHVPLLVKNACSLGWEVFLKFFLKSQFLFFSDIPEFQVGCPVNQQIKNMSPYLSVSYNVVFWSMIQVFS
jgi:hypothetical protein